MAVVTLGVTPRPVEAARAQSKPNVARYPFVVVPLPARRLCYDPVTRKLYVTVDAKGPGATANSVTAIDPLTGKVGASVFVGDNPAAMTVSAGGKYLYVAVSDGSGVRRIDLATMTAGPLYPMPNKPVKALLPLAGNADGFICLRGNHARYDDGLSIYVDGKLVGTESGSGTTLGVGIAPSRLFTYQNQLSSWDFDGYDIDADGVYHRRHNQGVMQGAYGVVGSLNGLVITENGGVIDPELEQVIGRLNFEEPKRGSLVVDPRIGYVYSISEDKDGHAIAACDVRNFRALGSVPLRFGVKGGVGSPVRWGADGFAYTADNKIVLFRMPSGVPLPPVDLAVERSALPELGSDNKLHYQLTVTNRGAQPASAAFVSDQYPAGADVLSVKASQGSSATAAEGKVRVELGRLAPGAKATVDVDLQFRDVRDVRFTAVVRGHEPDPQPENNILRTAPLETISPLADLLGEWIDLRQVSQGAGDRLQTGLVGAFRVRNAGKATSRPATVRFYVSAYPRFEAKESLLVQEVTLPPLRASGAFEAVLRAPLDSFGDVSGFHLFAVIDA
ncbi:MAG: hypothetical protein V4671_08200, partial [Armatimonadota bacterium]